MADNQNNQIATLIETADYLSPAEKELLLDILPSFPKVQLPELMKVLSGNKPMRSHNFVTQAQVKPKTPPSSRPPVTPSNPPYTKGEETRASSYAKGEGIAPSSNLHGLLKRMQKETVDLRKTPLGPPSRGGREAAHPRVRPVETTPSNLPYAKGEAKAQLKPKPAPHLTSPTEGGGKARPGKPITELNSPEDLNQVTLTDLRQGDFTQNLADLRDKIVEIAGIEQTLPYLMAKNFETSAVNKLFVQTGFTLMDDTSQDRSNSFARAANILQNQFGESFTMEEFEAFADFKDQLESLLYS